MQDEWGFQKVTLTHLVAMDRTNCACRASVIVPRRNEVAEGGYWITLRPSVRPSVHLE